MSYFFLDEVLFLSGTKNPKLIVDGHAFYFEQNKSTKTFWFCCMNSKTKCKVRVSTCSNVVYVNGMHNHYPQNIKRNDLKSKKVTIIRNM